MLSEMNSVNELTILAGVFLVLGVVCFYLYTRISYSDKKISLIENMLLDIKSELDRVNHEEPDYVPEPQGAPIPLETGEMEDLPSGGEDDGQYNDVLEQVHASSSLKEDEEEPVAAATTKVTANYESMTKAELTNLCKQRSLKTIARPGRAELIAALRKDDEPSSVPSGVSLTNDIFPLSGNVQDTTGFSVELGRETSE